MSRHPITDLYRILAQESDEGEAILTLCNALDREFTGRGAVLCELAGSKRRTITTVEEIEIGYVCLHGHFQFHGDSDGDACGTKRIGTVYVRADAEPNPTQAELAEAVGGSMSSLHRKIEAWRKS